MEQAEPFAGWQPVNAETRWGVIEVREGEINGRTVLFCPRHGSEHSVPPHMVNYHAIIAGLRELGADRVIGTAAVGSLSCDIRPGTAVVLTDFIDFTRRGPATFADGGPEGFAHTDFTQPYCPEVSDALLGACGKAGLEVTTPCSYICVDGPRYETPAEIRMFRNWGADVVGMTNAPEAILAREAGLCYGAVGVITNYACGISPVKLSHEEVLAVMSSVEEKLVRAMVAAVKAMPEERGCGCRG
jgi:5'-methylthioadenosine phosphorylase